MDGRRLASTNPPGAKVAICILVAALLSVQTPASGTGIEDNLESITNEVLRHEIDLERSYLKWYLVAIKEPKWRRARYVALQEASSGCFIGSSLFSLVESGKNLRTPEKIKEGPLRTSYAMGEVGAVIGGGSSLLELASNVNLAVQHKRQHQDPESQRLSIVAQLKEIDALLARRSTMIERLPPNGELANLALTEGRVLQLFREWCVYQYGEFYADIKSYQASNQVYYALDAAAEALDVVAFRLSRASLKHPSDAGAVSIVGMAADTFFIISGPFSTLAYNWLYKYWHRKLARQLKQDLEHNPQSDANNQVEMLSRGNGGGRRVGVYKLWSNRSEEYVRADEDRIRHLSEVALQGNISGPLIGSTYLASDIMGALAFYRYRHKPKTVNDLYFAGSIASGQGSVMFLALTAQWLIREKMFERKLHKTGKMPEQLIASRMKSLDELEKMIPVPATNGGTSTKSSTGAD